MMSYFIVFAGKGGTGKSTLAALTVRYLSEKNKTPLLVVDADPNYCLPDLLGVCIEDTVSSIRDNVSHEKPETMSLDEWLEIQINRIVAEGKGFDLLVMGRPEGSGCYCAINNVLKRIIQNLSNQYKYIVVDNEAGMEHISRGILEKINTLFIVATPAKNSIQAALRIRELIRELNLNPEKVVLLINQFVSEPKHNDLQKEFEYIKYISFDKEIYKLNEKGENIFTLCPSSIALQNFYKVMEEVL